jgi:hypothetical protein
MYLFDSDTFIGASRLYYSFDLAPGFWEWLGSPEIRQQVAPVDAVRKEVTAGTGPLVDWAKGLPDDFWLSHTDESLSWGSELSSWVMHPDRIYTQAARAEYLDKADFHLVAQAKAAGHTVVTMEKSEPNSKKRVKIPDACLAFGVPCVQPFQVYRTLGMRLS